MCAIVKRLDNGDEHIAYYKKWRAAHPEKCLAYSRKYKPDPVKRRLTVKRWEQNNYASKLLNSAKDTSRTYGWTCDLAVSDISIPERCPLLGMVLDCRAPSRSPNLPSIDRIDPTKGYVKGNVWVISWRANRLKSDATLDELRGIVAGLDGLTRLRLVGS